MLTLIDFIVTAQHALGGVDSGRNNDWGDENCLFSESLFKPIFVPLKVECNFRF
jgi:hypothetical protein